MLRAHALFAVFLTASALLSAPAFSRTAEDRPRAVSVIEEQPLGMVTGPKTGTYITIGNDIKQLVAAEGVRVEVKTSEGSIDNIKRINSNENAAIGIVQSDILGFLSRSRNPESMRMAANLRMVLPLYKEEVHVLARDSIKSVKDLDGKRVAIGEEGSGHMLTAVNLFAIEGIAPAELLKLPPPEGVMKVLNGEIDAIIFVGGKPVKLFQNMETLKGESPAYGELLKHVHLVPLDDPALLDEYARATITPEDYPFLHAPVQTIAATAVLISYDFAAEGRKQEGRCAKLNTLTQTIRKQLPTLQAQGHPKWKEVQLDAPVGIWKKDACAWMESPKSNVPLDKDLIGVIQRK